MDKPFQFKQFTIEQHRCAMKVGTDGVLLGGWTSLDNSPDAILDIGAGTGLIALMLAQRSGADTVDALEIDEAAYEQCVENFEASPWGDRLFCYHAGLDEFVEEWDDRYDLIVCNPPFFETPKSAVKGSLPDPPRDNPSVQSHGDDGSVGEDADAGAGDDARLRDDGGEGNDAGIGYESKGSSRQVARFHDSLSFEALVDGVSQLLARDGIFAVIIPFQAEENFVALASKKGLYPQRKTRVKGNSTSKTKRCLLQFGFEETEVYVDGLIIEVERHAYTPDYRALTREFYLNM